MQVTESFLFACMIYMPEQSGKAEGSDRLEQSLPFANKP